MSLEPGTTLGPYEVVAEIGRGGIGEVYRARDTKLDRDVALKVYRKPLRTIRIASLELNAKRSAHDRVFHPRFVADSRGR